MTGRTFSSMTLVHPWILLCSMFLARQHCGGVFQYMFYVKFSVWCRVYHFLLQIIVIWLKFTFFSRTWWGCTNMIHIFSFFLWNWETDIFLCILSCI